MMIQNKLKRWLKSGILPMRIRELVPDFAYATTRNNPPVALPQGPVLPKNVMPVGSIPEFPVIIPWLSYIA